MMKNINQSYNKSIISESLNQSIFTVKIKIQNQNLVILYIKKKCIIIINIIMIIDFSLKKIY